MKHENGASPEFSILLQKYLSGNLTDEESDVLFRLLPDHIDELDDRLAEDLASGRFDGFTDQALRDRLFSRLPLRRHARVYRWLPAVAAAVLLMIAGLWALNAGRSETGPAQVKWSAPPVPAGNKAVLVLGNGEVIQLESAGNGTLALQGGAAVSKIDSGMLSYKKQAVDAEPVFHTVATPKGGTYAIVLPDGSKAWLNAASTIRFPTIFDVVRTVEVSGEAYFEVAKRQGAKFEVRANGMKVSVLGTKFNVKAYADEPDARVTLVEGSVRFSAGADSAVLRPGEQGVTRQGVFTVAPADIEAATAWRNGMFHFDNQLLADIMREIGRWYDVEVQYAGNASGRRFSGIMRRSGSVGDVLKFMQLAGVKCELNGRKILVKQ
ncbi:FecR family protein [Chitinophaga rhizosphaerae]|uniref:FecR family protein n=1 Tax=Chitinophaga rhizosphaerae TaxID=1864947 RepID=UPI000F80A03E|nr:FecR domain-containing protein [Chitinophaga rhizosphaerae]